MPDRYDFFTEEDNCILIDKSCGFVLSWKKGRFNETAEINPGNVVIPPNGESLALYVARKAREMGDFVAVKLQGFV